MKKYNKQNVVLGYLIVLNVVETAIIIVCFLILRGLV